MQFSMKNAPIMCCLHFLVFQLLTSKPMEKPCHLCEHEHNANLVHSFQKTPLTQTPASQPRKINGMIMATGPLLVESRVKMCYNIQVFAQPPGIRLHTVPIQEGNSSSMALCIRLCRQCLSKTLCTFIVACILVLDGFTHMWLDRSVFAIVPWHNSCSLQDMSTAPFWPYLNKPCLSSGTVWSFFVYGVWLWYNLSDLFRLPEWCHSNHLVIPVRPGLYFTAYIRLLH